MKDGTQRLKTFQKNMKQAFHPMTTISKISYKILYSSCALAGQTGGATWTIIKDCKCIVRSK